MSVNKSLKIKPTMMTMMMRLCIQVTTIHTIGLQGHYVQLESTAAAALGQVGCLVGGKRSR